MKISLPNLQRRLDVDALIRALRSGKMKTFLSILTLLCFAQTGFGQSACPPRIEWQRSFGGSEFDIPAAILPVAGGYLVGISSSSPISGTRTAPAFGSFDIWVVHLDENGIELGQGSYGSSGGDNLVAIAASPVGGFVLAGNSDTADPDAIGLPGTKTARGKGGQDFWIARIDQSGDPIWDVAIGTFFSESLTAFQQLPDGGFILGGWSYGTPNDGQDKISPFYGTVDFWIVRLNSQGQLLWEKSFGGSEYDWLLRIIVTADGGFLLVGASNSPPDGNKTSPRFGDYEDGWVIRLDSNGNKLWEKVYGGTAMDWLSDGKQTADGGFILAGWSDSDHGGNRTSSERGAWVVRIDSAGTLLWDRSFGSAGGARVNALELTADGGFLLGGSGTGALTEGGVNDFSDFWIARIDASGNELWHQAYGGTELDILTSMSPSPDGGFLLAGYSYSGSSGNKTTPITNPQYPDAWFIKLAPEDPDCDHDGVPNALDLCPDTAAGAAVDEHGCSIEQLVPCSGAWKNHGEYLASLTRVTQQFLSRGLISQSDAASIIAGGRHSDCGKPSHPARVADPIANGPPIPADRARANVGPFK